jgi:dephospho-CoA kinase
VLDVPLLFENGGERRVDQVVVVSAPDAVQRARVLRRPGMTEERFAAIRARQMPDVQKRRRADHVVATGLSRHVAQAAIRRIMRKLRGSAPRPSRGRRAP